jgi:hypothetical protein
MAKPKNHYAWRGSWENDPDIHYKKTDRGEDFIGMVSEIPGARVIPAHHVKIELNDGEVIQAMKFQIDNELDRYIRQIHKLCSPHMHSLCLGFSPGIGWSCSIQESRYIEVIIGFGSMPSEAIADAINRLSYRKKVRDSWEE